MVIDPKVVFSADQQPSKEGGRLMHARYFHKKGLLFLILILFIILPVFSYGAEESVTVTTYYPSPYGVYSEMRLYPKLESDATVCNSPNQEGLMFYDRTMHALRVCRCDSGGACLLASEFDYTSANYWMLSDAETELYPNNPAWNVGIGTSSPGQKLVVQAADTASSTGIGATIYLQSDTSAAANRGGSVLFGDTGTTRAMLKGAYEGAGSSGYLALSTKTSANVMTEAIRINSSGNVGIGTTNPQTRLHVGGATVVSPASGSVLTVASNGDGSVTLGNIHSHESNSAYSSGMYLTNSATGSSGQGAGFTYSGSTMALPSWRNRLAFHSWANSVAGTGSLGFVFSMEGNSEGEQDFRINQGNDLNANVAFIVKQTGNVGIGTTSPQAKLDVAGGVRIGADTDGCAASKSGTMRYNSGNIEYCDGANWMIVGATTPVSTGIYGWCVSSGSALLPATFTSGSCACPSGYQRVSVGMSAFGAYYYQCYRN